MSAKNGSAFFLLTLGLHEQSYGQYKQAAHLHAWNEWKVSCRVCSVVLNWCSFRTSLQAEMQRSSPRFELVTPSHFLDSWHNSNSKLGLER